MSILIKRDNKGVKKALRVDDLVEGQSYMNKSGEVFICCRYGKIVAFSISGFHVVDTDCDDSFVPVDITITVHD